MEMLRVQTSAFHVHLARETPNSSSVRMGIITDADVVLRIGNGTA